MKPRLYQPFLTTPADVRAVTGILSRTRALELETNDPTFPRRIRLGARLTAWKTLDLFNWIEKNAVDHGTAAGKPAETEQHL